MSRISKIMALTLLSFFATAPVVSACVSDGSQCLNVSALETICVVEEYEIRLAEMAEQPEIFLPGAPNYLARLGDRGRFRMVAGHWSEGIADLDVVIADDPDNFYLYQWRGWAHLVLGNLDQAYNDFSQVIRLQETNAAGYLGLCRVGQARENWNSALADCQLSLDIRNATAEPSATRFIMGRIYEAKGLKSLARHSYQRALEANPYNERADTALAALDGEKATQ